MEMITCSELLIDFVIILDSFQLRLKLVCNKLELCGQKCRTNLPILMKKSINLLKNRLRSSKVKALEVILMIDFIFNSWLRLSILLFINNKIMCMMILRY